MPTHAGGGAVHTQPSFSRRASPPGSAGGGTAPALGSGARAGKDTASPSLGPPPAPDRQPTPTSRARTQRMGARLTGRSRSYLLGTVVLGSSPSFRSAARAAAQAAAPALVSVA